MRGVLVVVIGIAVMLMDMGDAALMEEGVHGLNDGGARADPEGNR